MSSGGFQMGKMPKSVTCYICGRGYGTTSIKIHIPNCEKKWTQEQSLKPKKERRPVPKAPSNWDAILNNKNVTHKDLQQLNDQAFEEYNEFSLERCQFCQRTFNSESFKKHQRICTAEKPMKPVNKNIPQKQEPKQEMKQERIVSGKQDRIVSGKQEVKQNPKIFKPLQDKTDMNNHQEEYIAPPKGQYNLDSVPEEQENQDLQECFKCGRNFISDRLAKHQKICKGNDTKPKKVKRFVPLPEKEQKNTKEEPKWKQQHKDLIETMKYMKQLKKAEERGEPLKNLPPPPKSRNPDFLECPSCNRSFNPTAHARHINVCSNIINKPKMLKRKDFGKNNRGY